MALTTHPGPVDNGVHTAMQGSLFGLGDVVCAHERGSIRRLDERSSVLFSPGWLRGSDVAFEQLRVEMPWRSVERPMYDRIVDVPRLICTVAPHDLDADHPLAIITRGVEDLLGTHFRSVGLNFYRTGNDSVAWHRDSIGRTAVPSTVALVSLGSQRTLAMRRFDQRSKTAETTRITAATRHRWRLGHGDLLVMTGACQHDWEHCVPKERGVGPRISLAFRSRDGVGGPLQTAAGVPT